MTTHAAQLSDRALLKVGGAQAKAFLQGLLTCDMEKVSENAAQAGALLTPQGKILFDLILIAKDDGYLIETAASARDDFVKRLNFYKLRAAVTVTPVGDLKVFALWGQSAQGFADPRWHPLGQRIYAENLTANAEALDYHAHRIREGVPEAEKDYKLGDTFPHEANFDLLNGVAFDKGCYIGQEVVSRMQHRGTARKRILPFEISGSAPPQTSIVADAIALGELGSSADGRALGLIRLDRLEEALCANTLIQAGSARLKPLQPPWANFMIAGNAA